MTNIQRHAQAVKEHFLATYSPKATAKWLMTSFSEEQLRIIGAKYNCYGSISNIALELERCEFKQSDFS